MAIALVSIRVESIVSCKPRLRPFPACPRLDHLSLLVSAPLNVARHALPRPTFVNVYHRYHLG